MGERSLQLYPPPLFFFIFLFLLLPARWDCDDLKYNLTEHKSNERKNEGKECCTKPPPPATMVEGSTKGLSFPPFFFPDTHAHFF